MGDAGAPGRSMAARNGHDGPNFGVPEGDAAAATGSEVATPAGHGRTSAAGEAANGRTLVHRAHAAFLNNGASRMCSAARAAGESSTGVGGSSRTTMGALH